MLDFVIEPLKRCNITTTDNPGNSSPCTTVRRFDNPLFVFFDPMKCHISSNSISLISVVIAGSGRSSASLEIHRYINECEWPKVFPSIRNEALPREYKITARAFFITTDPFTLWSPSTKFKPQSLHL